jgi:hypothetical protein
MATELELKMLARLRAHEVLIENLLRLAFNNDPDAVRNFAARQSACLDTARLPDLDPAMAARLPYETQEALASILDGVVRHVESRRPREPSA